MYTLLALLIATNFNSFNFVRKDFTFWRSCLLILVSFYISIIVGLLLSNNAVSTIVVLYGSSGLFSVTMCAITLALRCFAVKKVNQFSKWLLCVACICFIVWTGHVEYELFYMMSLNRYVYISAATFGILFFIMEDCHQKYSFNDEDFLKTDQYNIIE